MGAGTHCALSGGRFGYDEILGWLRVELDAVIGGRGG